MLECLVLGDSIAQGLGQFRPECVSIAKVGIGSRRYVQTMTSDTSARSVIISLGVNDDEHADTLASLRRLRARVHGTKVIWLLPGIKERTRDLIRRVAAENGDRTLDTRPQVGPDRLHPGIAGYHVLADATRRMAAR